LRLTEGIQRRTWDVLVSGSSWRLGTHELAARLDLSREHLSRQFAAGGAPNLKRVIDFLRIVTAAQLLTNPGYDLATVARLLDFSTVSHLHAMARRTAGQPAARLGSLAPPEILAAFVRVGTRSRRE
jgi:AraC-like DNA-binding protein